jgi:hypothetical protein
MTFSIQTRWDDYLSDNFSLAEMIRNGQGAENKPDARAVVNLTILAQHFLQPIRDAVGKPVIITSGYRNRAVNAAVGGSKTSAHMRGEAADFKVAGMTSQELARLIHGLDLPFDQLIAYAPRSTPAWTAPKEGWVHLGIVAGATSRARRQLLYSPSHGKYEPLDLT